MQDENTKLEQEFERLRKGLMRFKVQILCTTTHKSFDNSCDKDSAYLGIDKMLAEGDLDEETITYITWHYKRLSKLRPCRFSREDLKTRKNRLVGKVIDDLRILTKLKENICYQ